MKKRILLLLAVAFNYSALHAQTLFTYGNTAVDKEEFIRAYNKNNTGTDDKEKALKEYLELYSKFKLKVKAAKDARLDTLPQLSGDLQTFRSQIEDTYMNDEEAMNNLVNEAFTNAQKDLHVLHFFTALAANATAADSAKSFKAMQKIYADVMAGATEYTKIAAAVSDATTKIKAADVGYITAFLLPYEFEKIIYALKKGEASKPYRSKKGLHIFKVTDERKAVGKWKVAQILLAMPPGNAVVNNKILQQKADSLYLLLKAGADFAELAKIYSDDKLTYLSGGTLPEFTTGKFEPSFEAAVFALAKDGDFTAPFATPYGWHIVKRINVLPVQTTKKDAAYFYEIKQKVQQDSRVNAAKDLFTKNVIKTVNYKRNTSVKDAELFRFADSVVANPAKNGVKEFAVSNKIILTGKNNIKGTDWLNFVREYKTNPEIYKGENNAALLQKFITIKSLEYYKAHLENYNPAFRYQMEEFKEGNLLFEIMERKIWSSAATDIPGLMQYYNQHKSKYLWGSSADVIIYSCNNKTIADDAVAAVQKGTSWKKIAEQSNSTIQTDSGRYELEQITLPNGVQPAAGMLTPVVVNTTDGTAGFIKILKLHPANDQRSFEEAKGLVINDYQNILEEKWIAELRKKYPVKIDEKVFQTLIQ